MAGEQTTLMVIHPDEVKRSRELLGRGTYGTVYKGRWQGRDVAIKMFDASREINTLQKEVGILAQCQHSNIVRLYGAYMSESKNSSELRYPFYVMEFADSGTVADVVHNKPAVRYSIGLAFSWLLQCASAVAYLHSHQPRPIIHRDLKSMNLLLFERGRVLKVCDFGTVREQSTDMTSSKGTVAWMAPEILTNNKYSAKVDVYSFGIVMWEVLARCQPFKDMISYSIMFFIHAGKRPPPFKNCPDSLRTLLSNCLHHEPNKRYSMQQLLTLLQIVAPRLPGYEDELQYPPDEVVSDQRDPDVDIVVTEEPANPQVRVTNEPHVMPRSTEPPRPSDPMEQVRQVLLEDLSPGLRPRQPLAGSAESEELFRQHQRLLEGYIDEQLALTRLTQELKDVEDHLGQLVQPQQLQQLLQLKMQLEKLRASPHRSQSAVDLPGRC